jgi:hypothetical protein
MKRAKYKHIPTGIEVIKDGDKYYFTDNPKEYIRRELVENTNDWIFSIVGRVGYLLIADNDKVSFINEYSGIEYNVGDKISLAKNIKYSDGKRNFVIKSFYVSEINTHMDNVNKKHNSSPIDNNRYEFVYAVTTDGRDIHLNDCRITN